MKNVVRNLCMLGIMALASLCMAEPAFAAETQETNIIEETLTDHPLGVQVILAGAESAALNYTQEELDLMAAIIECEAGGECYEGKIAVGAVIMNRINSDRFPNTLEEVVYQKGQFSPAASGKLANVLARGAREDCYDAARAVFAGENTIGDKLFFNCGKGQGIQIGNQHFY